MKKIILVITILAACASTVQAMHMYLGPKLSLGEYSYRGEYWDAWQDAMDAKNSLSPSLALGACWNLQFIDFLGVQIEASLDATTVRVSEGDDYWFALLYTGITVPLYLRFDFDLGKVGLYLMAGPKFNILFDTVHGLNDDGDDWSWTLTERGYDSFVVAGAAAAGVYIPAGKGRFDIGLGFNTSLTQFRPDDEIFMYGIDLQFGYGFGLM